VAEISKLAIASMILGIISLLLVLISSLSIFEVIYLRDDFVFIIFSVVVGFLLSVLAIVLGFIAHVKIREYNLEGKNLATAGMIMGMITLFVIGIMVAKMNSPANEFSKKQVTSFI
jgi:hypothetical protein